MSSQEQNSHEEHNEDMKVIEKWREAVRMNEKLDQELDEVQIQQEEALLEKQVLEQNLEALRQTREGNDEAKVIANMQAETEKYSSLAEQDEKRAADLEAWCTRRKAKNQSHLEVLQRKGQELRKLEAEAAQLDETPADMEEAQRELSEKRAAMKEQIDSNKTIEECIEWCHRLLDEQKKLHDTHSEAVELESLLKSGEEDRLKLSDALEALEKKVSSQRTALKDTEEELRSVMNDSFSTIQAARAELDSIDPCEFTNLEILSSVVSEGKLYTDSNVMSQVLSSADPSQSSAE